MTLILPMKILIKHMSKKRDMIYESLNIPFIVFIYLWYDLSYYILIMIKED